MTYHAYHPRTRRALPVAGRFVGFTIPYGKSQTVYALFATETTNAYHRRGNLTPLTLAKCEALQKPGIDPDDYPRAHAMLIERHKEDK